MVQARVQHPPPPDSHPLPALIPAHPSLHPRRPEWRPGDATDRTPARSQDAPTRPGGGRSAPETVCGPPERNQNLGRSIIWLGLVPAMHAHAHQHQPRRRKRERCGEAKGPAPSSAQLVPASRPSPWPPAAQVRPRVRPMRPCTRPSRGSRRRGRLAADQVTLAADQVAQPSATSTTSSASSMQPEQASMHGASRLEPGRTHDAGRTDRSTAAQRCLTPAFCTTGPEHGGDAAADRAPLAVEAREEESSVAGARPARGLRGAHATEAHRASLLICAAECSHLPLCARAQIARSCA